MKYYHATARTNRESIRKHGLLLNVDASPPDNEPQYSPTGGFFFSTKLPEAREGLDVWRLDNTGLELVPDDVDTPTDAEDSWWVIYGLETIEPWRLALVDDHSTD
jgi:hypothetical protein